MGVSSDYTGNHLPLYLDLCVAMYFLNELHKGINLKSLESSSWVNTEGKVQEIYRAVLIKKVLVLLCIQL